MMLQGSVIDFPFRVDNRGAFVTTSDRRRVISQAIQDIIETRRGERVMAPDYGIPDFVFAVQNFSFGHRLAYILEEQIKAYVPLVKKAVVKVRPATEGEEGDVSVDVQYSEVDNINAPGNMVFPVWRLQQ